MTNEEILMLVRKYYPEAVSRRRYLHENPETGNREFKTTQYIADALSDMGIEVLRPLETGAVGVLCCGEGETVALRADIDALPVKEETGLSFASKSEGVMHACGHDIHSAALLLAARVLSESRASLRGTVKFVFQPDEEGDGGAERLISKGIFENPKVGRVFGVHISPELESGTVAVKKGKFYAASDVFEIAVHGKSAHGAQPHNGRNALLAAAKTACSLEGLVSQRLSPTDSAVLSVCTFESGSACNIIPEKAVITGILRTLGKEARAMMKKEILSLCQSTAKACGCEAEVKIRESYPGVVNCDGEADFVFGCAQELFGKYKAVWLSQPTMTTEDFGYYLDEAPGCFYHIGAGSEYPLHSGKLSPDEESIFTAAAMHVKTVVERLK